MSRGGVALLAETARASGLQRELRRALEPWTRDRAVHDPGRVVLQLAYALALGGDCLADIGMLRDATAIVGPVPSDPTVSRVIDDLAVGGPDVLDALAGAHAAARAQVHAAGGGPDIATEGSVPLDIDATIVIAHSEKEDARPTYKRTFGHHPVLAFLDHGAGGTGEALAGLLRPGNANANNATDLVTTLDSALAQLPEDLRARVLVRSDGGGYSHKFFDAIVKRGLEFSVGWAANPDIAEAITGLPEQAWTPAHNRDGQPREGADVTELTGLLELGGWPAGTRVIARREIPHSGAQLRLTDIDGRRITCLATNTVGGQLPGLELRHRRRARVEDRIRAAKDTGLGQPAAARQRSQRRLDPHRATRPRPAHLESDPRPDRPAASRRTQDPAPPAARRGRPHRPHRPTPTPAPGQTLALGDHPGRGHHQTPGDPRHRLTPAPVPATRGPGTTPPARQPTNTHALNAEKSHSHSGTPTRPRSRKIEARPRTSRSCSPTLVTTTTRRHRR